MASVVGLRVGVHEAIEKSDGIVFRCNLSGSQALRWPEIAAWMFDRTACANLRVAADGHPDCAITHYRAITEKSETSRVKIDGGHRALA